MLGVKFGDKHTYWDWGMLMKTRPVISPPKPKIKLIPVPGSDFIIDLTESQTGKIHYEPRTISFEFISMEERERWPALYSDILNYIHGRRLPIVMDDDPNFYYVGRVSVDEMKTEKKTVILTMTATVEPYKHEINGEGKCL